MKNTTKKIAQNVVGLPIEAATNAKRYIIDNYLFFPDGDNNDISFTVELGRHQEFIASSDDIGWDSEEYDDYESTVLAAAAAAAIEVQKEIDALVDDDNFYICYTENSDKYKPGARGYNSVTGYLPDAYGSHEEAQTALPNEKREPGYHCTYVIVKGLAAALRY